MWRRTWLALPLVALVFVAGGGASTASPSPAVADPSPASGSTDEPSRPPAAPPPAQPGPPLNPGDGAQVSGPGSCLNVRMQPALAGPDQDAAVLNCLPDG